MKTLHIITKYCIAMLILLILASLLLLAARALPQNAIDKNLLDSMYQLEEEGWYPHILDKNSWSNMLDMYSEGYIFNLSYYMNMRADWSSIYSNPNRENAVGSKLQSVVEQHIEANESYARYWGGFRVTGRFLLTFFSYMQIRRILSILIIILSGGTSLYLLLRTKRVAVAISFLVALSLLKPTIIASTLQFSCCFFIAMFGILLLPKTENEYITYPMYFFILGAVTQFFDFYTTPILTFGLPILALLCIQQSENPQINTKQLYRLCGYSFLSWLSAYIFMWIGKLILTTIFTDVDAINDGFSSAINRLFYSTGGIEGNLLYRMGLAIWRSIMRVFDTPRFLLFAVLLVFGLWLFLLVKRKKTIRSLLPSSIYLCVSALPLIWFIVVSGPSIRHSWFQYRGIGVFLFGVLLFVFQSTREIIPICINPQEIRIEIEDRL